MRSIASTIRSNYMIRTLFGLRGNPRYCVWLEPLWGIPYNLYLPYVTLFMTQLETSIRLIRHALGQQRE